MTDEYRYYPCMLHDNLSTSAVEEVHASLGAAYLYLEVAVLIRARPKDPRRPGHSHHYNAEIKNGVAMRTNYSEQQTPEMLAQITFVFFLEPNFDGNVEKQEKKKKEKK